jgi:predicted glycogen debranching enzyme
MSQPAIPRLALDERTCANPYQAESLEWWLTNGRGGYAAGTVAGLLTRRYHGLLIASLRPPLGRCLVLAKADATLTAGGKEWPVFANRWVGGVVALSDRVPVAAFALEGRVPVWRFAVGGMELEQRVWMEQGTDAVRVAWRLLRGGSGLAPRLRLALLADARDHHTVTGDRRYDPRVGAEGDRMVVEQGWFTLVIRAQGGALHADHPAWVEGFDLPLERERGLEDRDTHLYLGYADCDLGRGAWVGITAAVGEPPPRHLRASLARHGRRERRLLTKAEQAEPTFRQAPGWVRHLILAADAFLIDRPLPGTPGGASIIAGYPWFGDWGRDTMISLPGLTLATGRLAQARRILRTFAPWVRGGLLPNTFPGAGETPAYNSVDAALWYIEAWRAFTAAGGGGSALAQTFPVLEAIVRAYRDGTDFGIGMDPEDGLIRAGEPGLQLTWMDVKIGDRVVTPRTGKPVEVNALWFNALVAMQALAREVGADPRPYARLADHAKAGFRRFLRPDGEGLLDVIDGPEGDDASLRPNQILAVSLPASPLNPKTQARVVAVCRRDLLTPFGLRTLAPSHPDYRGQHLGTVAERDGAYHQGTVWGWLLGHFALAEYRVTGDAGPALARLAPMASHLAEVGLGGLGEVFDGDPPHRPRGAPLQAWTVACTLEAWWRLSRCRLQSPSEAPPRI